MPFGQITRGLIDGTHYGRVVCALLLAISACKDLKPPEQLAGAGTGGQSSAAGRHGRGTSPVRASAGNRAAAGGAGAGGQSGMVQNIGGGGAGAAGSAGGCRHDAEGRRDGRRLIEPIPDAGADASDGEVTPNPSGPIHGKVIDYYENPVPDIEVKLNGATTMTDARWRVYVRGYARDLFDLALDHGRALRRVRGGRAICSSTSRAAIRPFRCIAGCRCAAAT